VERKQQYGITRNLYTTFDLMVITNDSLDIDM
jgi:hypothetical protein